MYAKLRGKRMPENEKVAMHKHRGHAGWRCTVHLVPVVAALVLVVLNAAQYYIGGELAGASGQDPEKLSALQFAAKLHELTMLASLGTIIFTYIRWELAFGEGIPFGAVLAGLQVDSISLLWSSEFLGTIYSKSKAYKKFFLVSTIVVGTLLGVSVGPSTANLMRPRLDDWPAGGTAFWINATHDACFPSFVDTSPSLSHCDVDTGDPSCPYGNWEILSQNYYSFWPRLVPMGDMPEYVLVAGQFSARQLAMRHRSTNDGNNSIWSCALTLATVPSSAISDGVAEMGRLWAYAAAHASRHQHFMFRKDATYKVIAPQPFTQARCYETTFSTTELDEAARGLTALQLQLQFPVLSTIQYKPSAEVTPGLLGNVTQYDNSTVIDTIQKLLMTGSPPTLTWIDSAFLMNASDSTINVVATFPSTSSTDAAIYCCSIDSRVAQTTISGSRHTPKLITGEPDGWTHFGTFNPKYLRVVTGAAWARYLNPTISAHSSSTIFSKMASTAGMWNSPVLSQSYNFPFIVESIITTMMANGLARMTYNASIIGTLKGEEDPDNQWSGGEWVHEMLPKKALGYGSTIFDVSAQEQQDATMFTMKATVNGYAYSSRGILQKSAMVVLLFYSMFAVFHTAYSLWTGYSSTCWDTLPEIAALAVNSERTDKLRNTGAGTATVGVYEEKVRIMVKDNKLEFVFRDTDRDADMIRPNEEYG